MVYGVYDRNLPHLYLAPTHLDYNGDVIPFSIPFRMYFIKQASNYRYNSQLSRYVHLRAQLGWCTAVLRVCTVQQIGDTWQLQHSSSSTHAPMYTNTQSTQTYTHSTYTHKVHTNTYSAQYMLRTRAHMVSNGIQCTPWVVGGLLHHHQC